MAKAQTPYKMTKLSEIKPYERNPRIIPQAAVDAVAKSIQTFGFRQPLVVDGSGTILAGHTRYKAAQQLGLEEVPVVWQTDISEIQAKGYRIADNKTAEISAWDREALDDEVRQIIRDCDYDVKNLGLADWEIQRIMQAAEETTREMQEEVRKTDKQPGTRTPASTYEVAEEPASPIDIVGKPESMQSSVVIIFSTNEERSEFEQWAGLRGSGTVLWSNISEKFANKSCN